MKFGFCGGLEPPDWLLAEIHLFSIMSQEHVKEAIEALLNNISNLSKRFLDPKVVELVARDFSDIIDAKAVVTVLKFILVHGAKYDVNDIGLSAELLQLGFLSSIAETIADLFGRNKTSIRHHLNEQSLQLPHVTEMDWQVNFTVRSKSFNMVDKGTVDITLKLDKPSVVAAATSVKHNHNNKQEEIQFEMDETKFLALYQELQHVYSVLETLEGNAP